MYNHNYIANPQTTPRRSPRATLGEKLKELRAEKCLTQKQVAKAIFVTTSTLSHWECNYQEPSVGALIILCNFYNVSADYLFGLTDIT